jgi:hypothetical protein
MTAAVPKVASKIEDIHAENEVKAMFAPARREQRVDEVRSAEYTAFPRTRVNQTPRLGFTRDVSPLGMCLGVDEQEPIGSLLRIEVRQLDGQSIGATIGRVVWSEQTRDGRFWIGLDLLCEADGVRSKWHRKMLEGQD